MVHAKIRGEGFRGDCALARQIGSLYLFLRRKANLYTRVRIGTCSIVGTTPESCHDQLMAGGAFGSFIVGSELTPFLFPNLQRRRRITMAILMVVMSVLDLHNHATVYDE